MHHPFDVGALADIIAAFDEAFPDRVRGYYLLGSHADDSAIGASDLDLTVLLKGRAGEEERERAATLGALYRGELDLEVAGEDELAEGITPTLKFGSVLLQGEDVRADLPLMSIEEWTRDRMHAAYFLAINVFGRPVPATLPFQFPDPTDEFCGYAARTVRLQDGSEVASTRNLIRVTGWMAAARLAHEAGQFVARKRDCHVLYRQHIGDEWSALLEDLYVRCRGEWGYLIPEIPDDRCALRSICERVLEFENDFLARYKPYLLKELQERRERAQWVMERVPWDDPEIRAALVSLSRASRALHPR